MITPKYQRTGDGLIDRSDHVWKEITENGVVVKWLCVICGGSTVRMPPPWPSPESYMPECTEVLTPEDRNLVPRERHNRTRPKTTSISD